MSFSLSSPAFASGEPMPQKFTGEGDDCSPPLAWEDPPTDTRSFALTVEDPDAPGGTFHHWTVVNIAADARGLPEGFTGDMPVGDLRELMNGFGHEGYGGPLPPHGHGTHHYVFTLHALSVPSIELDPGEEPVALIRRLPPLTIATASTTATYER